MFLADFIQTAPAPSPRTRRGSRSSLPRHRPRTAVPITPHPLGSITPELAARSLPADESAGRTLSTIIGPDDEEDEVPPSAGTAAPSPRPKTNRSASVTVADRASAPTSFYVPHTLDTTAIGFVSHTRTDSMPVQQQLTAAQAEILFAAAGTLTGPHAIRQRVLSLSRLPASAALQRLRAFTRERIFPLVRKRAMRNSFVSRMRQRLRTSAALSGDSGVDVWKLVGEENGLIRFKTRKAARLAALPPAEREKASEALSDSMFRSLQTFHHLITLSGSRFGASGSASGGSGSSHSRGSAHRETLADVMQLCAAVLDAQHVSLLLIDDSGQHLKTAWEHHAPSSQAHSASAFPSRASSAASSSASASASTLASLPALKPHVSAAVLKEKARGLVGLVGRTGEIVNVPDAQLDPRFNLAIDRLTGRKTRALLCVPVRVHSLGTSGSGIDSAAGKVVAVLEVANKLLPGDASASDAECEQLESRPPTFSESDVSLLQFIALLCGSSIENHALLAETLVRKQQQEALSRMISLMSSDTEPQAVMQAAVDAAYALVHGGVEHISLYIVDEVSNSLVCRVTRDRRTLGQRLPLSFSILGEVATSGKAILIDDPRHTDSRYDDTLAKIYGVQTHNLCVLPILDRANKVAGVIECINKQLGAFSSEDEELLLSLSRSAGEILRKAQLFEALRLEQRKTHALLQMCTADESIASVDELAEKVIEIAAEALQLNVQLLAVCFIDRQSGQLMCIAEDRAQTKQRQALHRQTSLTVRISSPIADAADDAQPGSSPVAAPLPQSSPVMSSVAHRPRLKRLVVPLSRSLPSFVAGSGEALVLLSNSREHPNFDPVFDDTFGLESQSTLCLPIKSAATGSTYAVLLAINKLAARPAASSVSAAAPPGAAVAMDDSPPQVQPFGDEDGVILTALCQQASSSVRRRLTEFLLERSRQQADKQIDSMLSLYGTKQQPRTPSSPSPSPEQDKQNTPGMAIVGTAAPSSVPSPIPRPLLTARASYPSMHSNGAFLSPISGSPPAGLSAISSNHSNSSSGSVSVRAIAGPGGTSANMMRWNETVRRLQQEHRTSANAAHPAQVDTESPLAPGAAAASAVASTATPVAAIPVLAQTSSPKLQSTDTRVASASPPPRICLDSSGSRRRSLSSVSAASATATTPFAVTVSAPPSPQPDEEDAAHKTPDAAPASMSLAAAFAHLSPALRPTAEPGSRVNLSSSGGAAVPAMLIDSVTRSYPPAATAAALPPASWSYFPAESLVMASSQSRRGSRVNSRVNSRGASGSSTPRSLHTPPPGLSVSTGTASSAADSTTAASTASLAVMPVDSHEVRALLDSSPLLRPLAHLNHHSRHSSSPSGRALRQQQQSAPNSAGGHRVGSETAHAGVEQSPLLTVPSHSTLIMSRSGGSDGTVTVTSEVAAPPVEDYSLDSHEARVLHVGSWPSHLLEPLEVKDTTRSRSGTDSRDDEDEHLDHSSATAASLPIQLSPFQLRFASADVRSLTFDAFAYSEHELLLVSLHIFEDAGVIAEFGLQLDTLQQFLLNVRARYRTNPYHNWHHGFGVMQCAYMMLRSTRAWTFLTRLEHLALLVASLTHDIDHPGTTNQFQINCGSELALLHNDQSVLENMHASSLFRLLRLPECNILDPTRTELSQAAVRTLRHRIILAILATDMSVHFDTCKRLDALSMDSGGAASAAGDKSLHAERDGDRQFVLDLLVHGSDLSGQVYPLPVAQQWEARVNEEFRQQAQLEKALGLPVAPFMINLHEAHTRLKNHLGFLGRLLRQARGG